MNYHGFPNGKAFNAGTGVKLLGVIRKGDPKTDPRKPGKEHDYLRVDWNDQNADVMRKIDLCTSVWSHLYDEQPKLIRNVMFNRDSIDAIWKVRNELYKTTQAGQPTLELACDGQTLYKHRENGKLSHEPTMCRAPACDCSSTGRLFFWLPEFFKATGILGEFMLITHSMIDIQDITGTLQLAAELSTAAFGTPLLRRMSFDLERIPKRINAPNGMTVTKHLVQLSIADAEAQRLAGQYNLELTAGTATQPALPASTGARGEDVPEYETMQFERRIYVYGPSPEDPEIRYGFKSGGVWFVTRDAQMVQDILPPTLRVAEFQTDDYVLLPEAPYEGEVDAEDQIITLRDRHVTR